MANLRLNLSEIDKIKSIHKINKSLRKKIWIILIILVYHLKRMKIGNFLTLKKF